MSHPWDLPDGELLLRDVNMEESASQPSVVSNTNIGFFTCDGKSTYVLPTEGNGDAIVFNIVLNVLNIAKIFGVPFKTFAGIEELMNGIEMGKHEAVWSIMTEDRHKDVMDSMFTTWKRLMDDNPNVASNVGNTDHVDKTSAPSHESPIVQSMDINTKSTSYVGVAGAIVEKAKHRLKRIMMNIKCFFFFKFDTWAGLEAVLEEGPWMIHRSLIILKKWSMDTRLLKEELTRISIWVKLHDVPIQGRSSFVRCLIEVNLEADLVDVVTIGIPSLTGDDFTKETIFEKTNDGFQTVGKKKKRKGKSKSTNGGQLAGPSVKQSFRYEPKATTSAPKKGATNVGNASKSSSMLKTAGTSSKNDNITTSNSNSALNKEEDEEEDVEDVYDETDNLFPNTKTGGSSSFMVAAG
ncbi:zinc knuckle CX2CX4HX4C containing protein [Tanacetum coccineum]